MFVFNRCLTSPVMKRVGNTLRDYQEDMKRRVLDAWEHENSVLVQMPTGTGKTVVLASLVYEHLRICKGKPGCLVWIVAHRRELVEQIEGTVAKFGIGKHDWKIKVRSIQWLSRHWDDVKNEKT